jgi:hypothetical protein
MKPDAYKVTNNYYISFIFKKIRLINSSAYCRTENSLSDNRMDYNSQPHVLEIITRNVLKNNVWCLKCIKLTE